MDTNFRLCLFRWQVESQFNSLFLLWACLYMYSLGISQRQGIIYTENLGILSASFFFFPEFLPHFLTAMVRLSSVFQVFRSECLQVFYWSFGHFMPNVLLLTLRLKVIKMGNSFNVGSFPRCSLPSINCLLFFHSPVSVAIAFILFGLI